MSSETSRTFVCKRCGNQVTEPRSVWKKKSQKDKRICEPCRKKRELSIQTAREKAQYAGYNIDLFRY